MAATDTPTSTRRRPQWRGEREAVLVRMPTDLAQRLRQEAERRHLSLSDTAACCIAQQLSEDR